MNRKHSKSVNYRSSETRVCIHSGIWNFFLQWLKLDRLSAFRRVRSPCVTKSVLHWRTDCSVVLNPNAHISSKLRVNYPSPNDFQEFSFGSESGREDTCGKESCPPGRTPPGPADTCGETCVSRTGGLSSGKAGWSPTLRGLVDHHCPLRVAWGRWSIRGSPGAEPATREGGSVTQVTHFMCES